MIDFEWHIPRGDTRTLLFHVINESGADLDLTGYTVTITGKRRLYDELGDPMPTAFQRQVMGAGTEVLVALTPSETEIAAGTYETMIRAARDGYPGPYSALGRVFIDDHP